MKWERIQAIIWDVLALFGIMHILVVTHEIVHMIDGWTPKVAMCFSFADFERMGFVIHGENYTLYRGEPLAYAVSFIILLTIYLLLRKKKNAAK